MGVTFTREDHIVVFVLADNNTLAQAERAFLGVFGDPEDERVYSVLIDARTSLRHRDLSEVSVFAELLTTFRRHIGDRCALVMDEKRPKSMELERRLAGFSLREKIEFALFYDIEAAKKWIEETAGV